jgi:polysaccharide deacetylase 2 family uncharacterized protein YibQ
LISRSFSSARPAACAGRAVFLILLLLAAGTAAAGPVFELYPENPEAPPPPAPVRRPGHRLGHRTPRVAIIIDDIGFDAGLAQAFLALEIPLTFSLLPHAPHRETLARQAIDAGVELMLHLPMEPLEYPRISPGPEALLSPLSGDVLAQRVAAALARLPGVRGVNNHMGSRLTGLPAPIHRVLSLLRERDLYFVDSVTRPGSMCRAVARRLQIPFARRDVFLDHDPRPAVIRRQIRRLIQTAHVHGQAVGIGHPHAATLDALAEARALLMEQVQLVPASRIVNTPG